MLRNVIVTLIATASLCIAPLCARAESCPGPGRPGVVESTPASGAGAVTLDAPMRFLYTPGYFAEGGAARGDETIVLYDDAGAELPGVVSQVGDALLFVPDALLAPSSSYRAIANDAYGVFELRFTTGVALDQEPPIARSITAVSTADVGESCDAPAGIRVAVSFLPATDDGALGSIEYQLFLAPPDEEPVRVARQRHFATGGEMTMGFVLVEPYIAADVCVFMRVEDGVGRSDVSETVCFDPATGVRFAPLCAVRAVGGGASGGSWLALFAGLGAALLLCRRRDPYV